jgi:hypothetical protein
METGQQVVKAKLPDGTVVRLEARTVGSIQEDVSALSDALKFEGVVQAVESISTAMTTALARVKPDKATVEFGVDVAVEAGGLTALLVKGTGTATLTVTLEWESGSGPAPPE